MKITTKFNVGDILKFKFDGKNEYLISLQIVKDITTQTCYVGTQIFYYCRLVQLKRKEKTYYEKDSEYIWLRGHMTGSDNSEILSKYREDDLIKASDEEIKLLKQC